MKGMVVVVLGKLPMRAVLSPAIQGRTAAREMSCYAAEDLLGNTFSRSHQSDRPLLTCNGSLDMVPYCTPSVSYVKSREPL